MTTTTTGAQTRRDLLECAVRLERRLLATLNDDDGPLAARLRGRIRRFERSLPTATSEAERVRRDAVVPRAVAWAVVHDAETLAGPSLVAQILDGVAPVLFDVDARERGLLEQWRGGGVGGFFEVVHRTGRHAVLRNLSDELPYRVFSGTWEHEVEGLAVGTAVSTQLLPVGDSWMIAGEVTLPAPEHYGEFYRGAWAHMVQHASTQYRNPRFRRRALELAGRHHEVFLEMFGAPTVDGPPAVTWRSMDAFLDAIGGHGQEFVLVDALRDVHRHRPAHRGDAVPLTLAHHPVKGLRVMDVYADLRRMHESGRFEEWVAEEMEESRVPSWALRLLAEQHPRYLDRIYRELAVRREFDWARDAESFLADREPQEHPDLPGLRLVPSWIEKLGAP